MSDQERDLGPEVTDLEELEIAEWIQSERREAIAAADTTAEA